MKIILDHKDLKNKLTTLLASEGIGLESEPQWGTDDAGKPIVTLEVAPIPAEVKAKTIGEHLEVFLLEKLLSMLEGIQLEHNHKMQEIMGEVDKKFDYLLTTLTANVSKFTSKPQVATRPIQVKPESTTNTPSRSPYTTEQSNDTPTMFYSTGLEKQKRAQQQMLYEINKKIEEESQEVQRPIAPNEYEEFPG